MGVLSERTPNDLSGRTERGTAAAICGGWNHEVTRGPHTLEGLLRRHGFGVVSCELPDQAVTALNDRPDLVVVSACWMAMRSPTLEHVQAQHGVRTSRLFRASLASCIDGGVPLLVVHAGAMSFEDWSEWSSILHANRSSAELGHGDVDELIVNVSPDHRRGGVDSFTVTDASVRGVSPLSTATVLATVNDEPTIWRHRYGSAKVAVDLLGHGEASWSTPEHREIQDELIEWLMSDQAT